MKINWTAQCHIPAETLERNTAHARSLGFPRMGEAGASRLAVVGGGPSILNEIEWLRAFDGDIWAINGAFHWCQYHGFDAAFCSVDPSPKIAHLAKGADRAIVAMHCDPSVFETLSGADLTAVEIGEGKIEGGPTTATAIPMIAIEMGYREVTFLGCEGSDGATSHAYENRPRRSVLKIEANDRHFSTCPEMFMQAEFLAEIIRAAPNVFKERSSGLLWALIANPDYHVIACSRSIYEALNAA